MTTAGTAGYLLDTSALTAIATSQGMSVFLASADQFRQRLHAPVTCIDAADRIRPGIARHVARVSIEPIDLTYADVLDLRECTPKVELDVAHVITLARPRPWSDGFIVATAQPDLYSDFDVPTHPIGA